MTSTTLLMCWTEKSVRPCAVNAEAGEDLLPVFLSLVQWGEKQLQKGQAPLS